MTASARLEPRRDSRPAWVEELLAGATGAQAHQLSRFQPPPGHPRRSAVLMLFGALPAGPIGPPGDSGDPDASNAPVVSGAAKVRGTSDPSASDHRPAADVLLTERAATLRSHAGQVAFPGGHIDAGDDGPAAAALREAQEETGLDPGGVEVLAELPDLYVPVSDIAVTPVLAWWHTPSPVGVVDAREVAQVARVPVPDLLDPENRFRAVHPSGFVGPAFRASGLFIWGFTAGLLDRLLTLSGWERPWDRGRLQPVPMVPGPPADRRPRP